MNVNVNMNRGIHHHQSPMISPMKSIAILLFMPEWISEPQAATSFHLSSSTSLFQQHHRHDLFQGTTHIHTKRKKQVHPHHHQLILFPTRVSLALVDFDDDIQDYDDSIKSTRVDFDDLFDDELQDSNDSKTSSPNLGALVDFDDDDLDHDECPFGSCLITSIFASSTCTTSSTNKAPSSAEKNIAKKNIFNPVIIIPILSPICAYLAYDDVAKLFNAFIDLLNINRTWAPVDGGAYQARIIAPAINGIVIPAISILFATLISNTVATLRQRQIEIHTCLNTEAGDLRVLSSMVSAFPSSLKRDKCREYLTQYTTRLIAESNDKINFNSMEFQGSTDSEMNGFLAVLNQLAATTTTVSSSSDGDGQVIVQSCPRPNESILSESYGAVIRLNSQRSSRITYLQATYPSLHYAILATLGFSIAFAFLIETNQELLIFLNAIQLRILWTMLIGTFSALAVVCYDLSGPFRGQYQISNAVYQLMTIRDTLKTEMSASLIENNES